VKLGEVCEVVRGSSPRPKSDPRFYGGKVPRLMVADLTRDGKLVSARIDTLTELGARQSRPMTRGDVVIAVSGAPGLAAILAHDACIHDGFVGLRDLDRNRLDAQFLYAYLTFVRATSNSKAVGAIFKNLTTDQIKAIEIPELPLAEQRRIAEVLDRAEALRAKRRAALVQLASLTQSLFLDFFGDPATNPKRWPSKPVGSLAFKFSDGPFGSNLKSERYTEAGVRVIRLQNIGVGEFVDNDAAYISEHHFAKLKKHECRPGDVIVGTLGDPNLRACIQPKWLMVALNKADCVQLRPDERVANAIFICALLNQPAAERMAQELMHGQTRVRISMGRLRGLEVPVPLIELQREFARRVGAAEKLKTAQRASLAELDALFASLQHRAFRGES